MVDGRRVVAAAGLALFVFSWAARRRSRERRHRAAAAAAGGGATSAEPTVAHGTSVADGALPVDVNPSRLPAGWAVAPPVYRPAARQVIIPLVTPAERGAVAGEQKDGRQCKRVAGVPTGAAAADALDDVRQSALLLCEGPFPALLEKAHGAGAGAAEVLAAYVADHPTLQSVLREATAAVPGAEVERVVPLSQAAGAFTHVVTAPDVTLLLGLHGAYVASALLSGFLSDGQATESDAVSVTSAVAAVLGATVPIPVRTAPLIAGGDHGEWVSALRLPGTPSGAHSGQYRVTVTDDHRTVVLGVPPDVVVRQTTSAAEESVFSLEGCSPFTGQRCTLSLRRDDIRTVEAGAPSLAAGLTELSPAQRELAGNISVLTVQSSPDRHTATAQVTVVYTHPHLRAFFSVEAPSGVVHDPILTDMPLVMYYPRGVEGDDSCVITLQEYPSFPPTWERARGDDDELVHNVRFHFTEWDQERTECAVTELSGLKGVVFTETKGGVTCRSYVVPRKQTILAVRCEVPASLFDAHRPHLQDFLDTLHVDL